MLNSLSYSVTFPSTGRTLQETIDFKEGFGAITGPNEAGKSFIIEMIRWLMYGTSALRGTSDDYKNLSGELSFSIKGVTYVVKRTISTAKLFRGEEEIAVGVRPVNGKIVQILGYGLAVFDVAHVANQGDLEKLADMAPADRKRMVDSVIGLGVIEDLAKAAGDEATSLFRRAEDLRTGLVKPVEPIAPDPYRPAKDVRVELDSVAALKSEYDQLVGWLSHERARPIEPTTDIEYTTADLTRLAGEQTNLHSDRVVLLSLLDNLPEPSRYSAAELDEIEEQLDAYDMYRAQQQFLALHPTPVYSEKDLRSFRKFHENWQLQQQRDALEHRIAELEEKGFHSCPKCEHEWPVEADSIDHIRTALDALPRLRRPATEPKLSLVEIEDHERRLAAWNAHADEWANLRQALPTDAPVLDRRALMEQRLANKSADRRVEIQGEILSLEEKLRDMPNYSKLLLARQAHDQALERYRVDQEAYDKWKVERDKRSARRDVLERLIVQLPTLQAEYDLARTYEAQLAAFNSLNEAYTTALVNAEGFAVEATEWSKAKDALTNLRILVKQHLVPSLNKVASHLIKQMTGGQRQQVIVDDKFNIMVDNQPINTLSGSGKAVANLALRLGLGQVLTNNIFSLFVGDEIDASMDKDRAENTANTLQTLKQRISQILLVTHKLPVADYYISLGKLDESEDPTD